MAAFHRLWAITSHVSTFAGIHFVSIVNRSDCAVELCATVGVCCTGCCCGESPGPDLLRRSITPWVSNICWRSSCAITGSTAGVGACVGPGSKNCGGIPNVAVLPLSQMWQCCHSAHSLQDRIDLAIQLEYDSLAQVQTSSQVQIS